MKKRRILGVGKMMVLFLSVSGPTFMKFCYDVGDPLQFPSCFPIISTVYLLLDGDIGPQVWH